MPTSAPRIGSPAYFSVRGLGSVWLLMQKAFFFDRDDTLVDTKGATAGSGHEGDMNDPAAMMLLPGVGVALRRLQEAGFAMVVVTNQGGIAAGTVTLRQVEEVNDRLRELLGAFGVRLDGVYFSPHRPAERGGKVQPFVGEHPWRKPQGGMAQTAAKELGLDLSGSWTVGDMPRDPQAGLAAGLKPEQCFRIAPEERFQSVAGLVEWVLGGAEETKR